MLFNFSAFLVSQTFSNGMCLLIREKTVFVKPSAPRPCPLWAEQASPLAANAPVSTPFSAPRRNSRPTHGLPFQPARQQRSRQDPGGTDVGPGTGRAQREGRGDRRPGGGPGDQSSGLARGTGAGLCPADPSPTSPGASVLHSHGPPSRVRNSHWYDTVT